jgi:DNA polymerase-3 subunit gamma/tau
MRLDFKRVPEHILIKGMTEICSKRGIEVTEDALRIIAANADGSVRDGLSILDQCISGGDTRVDAKDVLDFLGASGEETFVELTDLVRKGKTSDAIILLGEVLSDGKDVRQFMRDWVNHYRNLMMTKFIKNPQDIINMSFENIERIRRQSEVTDLADINRGILELSRTMNEARWSTQPRILLELAIVKLSTDLGMVTEVQVPARKAAAAKEQQPAHAPEVHFAQKAAESDEDRILRELHESARSDESFDLERIWSAVFADGEASKGSFYIIGSGSKLTEIGENTFTVLANSDHVKGHAERNRDLMEDLMEKHTGKRRAMRIISAREPQRRGEKSVEDIAKDVGDILGINVEIQ